MNLASLQRWFVAATTSPEPVELGAHLERLVTPGPRLSAHERVEIYRFSYFARLVECLGDDYPALASTLGDDAFAELARAYVSAHPSRAPNLNGLGRHMAEFCRARGDENAEFLSELARLEWALTEVLHAPLGAQLGSDLASVPPESWPRARFSPSPALRLLRFRYPVNAYLQAFRDGERPAIPDLAPSATAVYRTALTIWRLDLDVEMACVLESLMAGNPLGAALAGLEVEREPNERGRREIEVGRAFRSWVSEGFFSAVSFD